jgi:hypothetical protein
MLNFNFKRSGRKCYESEREFQPGENFFSALIELDNGSAERRDFSGDHWDGPTKDCIGWWKSSVPEVNKGRVYWAPKHVLLAYFEHVCKQESAKDLAFVTGLLLVQKKILSLEHSEDATMMCLRHRTEKTVYEIPSVDIAPARLMAIQDELSERLFMDQPANPDSDEVPDFPETFDPEDRPAIEDLPAIGDLPDIDQSSGEDE